MQEESPHTDQADEHKVSSDLVDSPTVITSKPAHKRLNIFAGKGKYEILVLVILLLGVGAAAYYFGRVSKQNNQSVSTNSSQPLAVPVTGSSTANLPPAEFASGNTYFDSAKKLPDLKFFASTEFLGGTDQNGKPVVSQSDVKYYQAGTTKDGKQIIIFSAPYGIGGLEGYALGDGSKYSLLLQMDPNLSDMTDLIKSLNSNITLDKTTKLNDISFPLSTIVNDQELKAETYNDETSDLGLSNSEVIFMTDGLPSIRGLYFGSVKSDPVKIADKGNLSFYKVTTQDAKTFQVQEIYGAYKNLFSASYRPAGEIASTTGDLHISWSSGANNTSSYFSGGQGCGTRGYVIAKNLDTKQLKLVGKTPQGQPVYQLPATNPLAQEIFTKDYAKGAYLDNKSLKNLTIQKFTDDHSYFLAKNGFNEYMLFQRNDMFIRGGCAKPVIYLYPQQKQQVSVSVGAQVINSSPAYGNGWDNVTAYPDGSLIYKGKVYSSLFWDGYGNGDYPDIQSGTIVATRDAVSTVVKQLAAQGLNQQEISDFIGYWKPKLEAVRQPFTRLTWLDTAQMNQLAPLYISPKPQTLIRVFLDFEGLKQPYPLNSQPLQSLQRRGFTVVEWGGLARNGLGN